MTVPRVVSENKFGQGTIHLPLVRARGTIIDGRHRFLAVRVEKYSAIGGVRGEMVDEDVGKSTVALPLDSQAGYMLFWRGFGWSASVWTFVVH